MTPILEIVRYLYGFFNWMAGLPLAILILTAGVILMVASKFMPVRRFFSIIKIIFSNPYKKKGAKRKGRQAGAGDISPFQALTTALSATVGTGNIAGVATALTLGGPGAIFWMWVSAFFGAMVKYGEVVLAIHYRDVDKNGEITGGPMYVLDYGLRNRKLAIFYAGAASLAVLGFGNILQANSVAGALQASFAVPPFFTGIALVFPVGLVILGGIKRIGSITSKIVPMMTLFYIGGAICILVVFRYEITGALGKIITEAFTGASAVGGFAGAGVSQAIRYGVTRGIFSNEAGMGTGSIAHAAARTEHPARQGLWGVLEVVIDTHIICTITALVLLVTGAWTSGLEGAAMTVEAFNRGLPGEGGLIVSISMIFFAFSTLIAISYYGERCIVYLFGRGILVYRLFWLGMIPVGATGGLRMVWQIAETLNLFVVIPNLIAVLSLIGVITRTNKDFWSK